MDWKTAIVNGQGTVIDVREPWELMEGQIEGAVNIPLNTVMAQANEIAKLEAPRVLVCRSGNRSGMAVALLKAKGIDEVHNGGAWNELVSLSEAIRG